MAAVIGCPGGGGRLIAVESDTAVPITVALSYVANEDPTYIDPGAWISPPTQSSGGSSIEYVEENLVRLGVMTNIRASQQIAAQFQNALSDIIYVTPFGDVPGEVQITFIANRKCDDQINSFNVIQHYLDRRLLPDKNKLPARITIGSAVFTAYLVALNVDAVYSDIPIVRGTLGFRAWPT